MELIHTTLAGVFDLTPSTSDAMNPQDWFLRALGINDSDSGLVVDEASALTVGPIFEAVSIISGDVGMLPIHVYKRLDEDNKEKDRKHPASKLLRREPHPEMRPLQFRERMMTDALLWGNGVAFIDRQGPTPKSLTPCEPSRTQIRRDRTTGKLVYITRDDLGEEYFAFKEDVFHLVGFGNGIWGMSVIEAARNSWGMRLAAQKHGNKLFANGAVPQGILTTDVKLTSTQSEGIRREWNQVHQGSDEAGKIAILGRGTEYKQMTMSNRDAEWLAGMEWGDKDVVRWFKLPPHKIGYLKESAVRANIVEQNREYLEQCLSPWLVRFEQEAERKLLGRQEFETESHFIRFNTAGLLKGDFKSQMEAIQIARQAEVYSINDGRRILDENTIGPEGDEYRNPATRSDSETADVATTDDGDVDQEPSSQSASADSGSKVTALVQHATESLQRIQTLERRELTKAAKHKSKDFDQAAAKFYDRSRDYVCDTISSVVRMGQTLALTPPTVSAEALAQTWMTESYDRVTVAAGSNGDILGAVEQELKTWPTRQDAMLATLLGRDNHESRTAQDS